MKTQIKNFKLREKYRQGKQVDPEHKTQLTGK